MEMLQKKVNSKNLY